MNKYKVNLYAVLFRGSLILAVCLSINLIINLGIAKQSWAWNNIIFFISDIAAIALSILFFFKRKIEKAKYDKELEEFIDKHCYD